MKSKVLLIDDDPTVRLLAAEVLTGAGLEVIEADGGGFGAGAVRPARARSSDQRCTDAPHGWPHDLPHPAPDPPWTGCPRAHDDRI